MVSRGEYLLAIEKVDTDLVDTLRKWLVNESSNLQSFIENPEGHIMNSPYIKPDFEALKIRHTQLLQAVQALATIIAYDEGSEGATQSMRDYSVDALPVVLWKRLLDWMKIRYDNMVGIATGNIIGLPVSDYASFMSFDAEKYEAEIIRYGLAIEGVSTIIEYKNQL